MNEHASILAWFNTMMERWNGSEEGSHQLTLVTTILWNLWKCRNEKLFRDTRRTYASCVYSSLRGGGVYFSDGFEGGGKQGTSAELE